MPELSDPQVWVSLLTLTAMEIVLGIDNLVFMTILADRLPEHRRASARRIGLFVALGMRVSLLLGITWIMRLNEPIFATVLLWLSWRDVILIAGGLFLVYKGTREIHDRIDGARAMARPGAAAGYLVTVAQIGLLDVVFSLDSVITAFGMASDLAVMVAAVVISMGVMLAGAGTLGTVIGRQPRIKMLALSFLLLIGFILIAEGSGAHVPKGYIYAAMGFSAMVELLNQLAARSQRIKAA